MGRIKGSRPSPAIVISIVALVFAIAGTAVAGVATVSVLNKKEKKQSKNIARNEINKAAPGLSVANAAQLGGKTASDYLLTHSLGVALQERKSAPSATSRPGSTRLVAPRLLLHAGPTVGTSPFPE